MSDTTTDATQEARAAARAAASERVNATLTSITNSRWLATRRALGLTVDEILDDTIVMYIVAANEEHRAEHGNDAWTRYLELSPLELRRHLGVEDDAEPIRPQATPVELQEQQEAEDDSKSADPVGGRAAGAGAAPGQDVPGPGDHA